LLELTKLAQLLLAQPLETLWVQTARLLKTYFLEVFLDRGQFPVLSYLAVILLQVDLS
jgi:hypothetical protein